MARARPGVEETPFGRLPDGRPVSLFTVANTAGMLLRVASYGTIITELHVPDRAGNPGDVVLGFDNLAPYLGHHPYFGCTVGRVANRIGHARLVLDGVEYVLSRNAGRHHLHGGFHGLDKVLWEAEPLPAPALGVRFSHVSPDGTEGYPGRLAVSVTMALSPGNVLTMTFEAATDRPTAVSLTNHSYFNLAGGGDVLGHELQVLASRYAATDAELIPTGELEPVAGTALDFGTPRLVGARLAELAGQPQGGYDHYFVLDHLEAGPVLAARLAEPRTGRTMELHTTAPGFQLYSGNGLDGTLVGKRGMIYRRHSGLCLEAHGFPDAMHHPAFTGVILRPGEQFRQVTSYRFGVI